MVIEFSESVMPLNLKMVNRSDESECYELVVYEKVVNQVVMS